MRRQRCRSWRYGSLSLLGALLAIALPAPAGVESCNVTADPTGPVQPGAYVDFRSECTGAPIATYWSGWGGSLLNTAYCAPVGGPETTCNFPFTGAAIVTASAAYPDGYGGSYLVSDSYPMTVTPGAPPTCIILSTPRSPVQPGAWADLTAACTGNPTSFQWSSCLTDCSPLVGPTTTCKFPTAGAFNVSVRATYMGCLDVADGYTMVVGFAAPPSCRVTASPSGPLQPGAWAEVTAECTANPTLVSWASCLANCAPATGPVVQCNFPQVGSAYLGAYATYGSCLYASDGISVTVSPLAAPTCSILATPSGPVDPGGTSVLDSRCVGTPSAIDWSSCLANCSPPAGPTTTCAFPNIGTSVVTTRATYPMGPGSSLIVVDDYAMKVSGASCSYGVAPLDLSNLAAAGGPQIVTVTTPAGCPVNAQSFQPWVSVVAIEPTGVTTIVRLQLAPNTGPPRATSVVLAGRLYQVTQLGP